MAGYKLHTVLTAIAQVQARQREQEEALENTRKEIETWTEAARKKLLDGETSEDIVRDLVIRAHGFSPELEAFYRPLQEKLKGKKGQLVMIRYSTQEPWGIQKKYGAKNAGKAKGVIAPPTHVRKEWLRIGILEDDTLVLKEPKVPCSAITLPISRYVGGPWPEMTLVEDNLFNPGKHGKIFPLIEFLQQEYPCGELFVGAEVKTVFEEAREGVSVYQDIVTWLGSTSTQHPEHNVTL